MSEQIICNICFESIGANNSTVTPCGHQFCFTCFMRAYQIKPECPCCRNNLHPEQESKSDDEEDEQSETDSEYSHQEHGEFEDEHMHRFPLVIETIDEVRDILHNTGHFGVLSRYLVGAMLKMEDPDYDFDTELFDPECGEVSKNVQGTSCFVESLLYIFKTTQHFNKMLSNHYARVMRGEVEGFLESISGQ